MTVQESAEPRLSLRLGPPSVAFPHGYFISAARFRFGQDSAKIRWSFVFSAVFGSTAVLRDDRDADGPVLLESQLGWGEQWSWFYWKKLAGMNVGCVDSQWWECDFVSCCIVILYLMPIAPSSTSLLSHGNFFWKPKWLSPCKCQRPFFLIPSSVMVCISFIFWNGSGDVTALCDISASSKKKPLPGVAGGSIGCTLGMNWADQDVHLR